MAHAARSADPASPSPAPADSRSADLPSGATSAPRDAGGTGHAIRSGSSDSISTDNLKLPPADGLEAVQSRLAPLLLAPAGRGPSTAVLVAMAAGTAVLNTLPLWLSDYVPGGDESWMLQAGARLARGLGMTTAVHDMWTDLSAPTFVPMHYWTPTQSWLYAGLLRSTGMDIGAAFAVLVALQSVSAFAGALGWLLLARRVMPPIGVLAFWVWVTGPFFADGTMAAAGHLHAWAGVPWGLLGLLRGAETGRLAPVAWAGVALAWSVSWRFHVNYLTPAGALTAVLLFPGPWRRRLVAAAVASVPPALMMASFVLYGRMIGAGTGWVADLPPDWSLRHIDRQEPFAYWTGFGFGLREWLLKLRPAWQFHPQLDWWLLPWHLLLWAVAIRTVWRRRQAVQAEDARSGAAVPTGSAELPPVGGTADAPPDMRQRTPVRFLAWLGLPEPLRAYAIAASVFGAGTVGLLCAVSLRGEPTPGFTPAGEPRLYTESLPAIGLLLTALMLPAGAVLRRWRGRMLALAVTIVLAVLAVRGIVTPARAAVKAAATVVRTGRPVEVPVVTRIRELIARGEAAGVRHVAVFDVDTDAMRVLRCDGLLRADRIYEPKDKIAVMGTSRPTLIIFVRRHAEWEQQAWIEDFVRYLRLPSAGRVPQAESVEIFAGVVQPFSADRPPAADAARLPDVAR